MKSKVGLGLVLTSVLLLFAACSNPMIDSINVDYARVSVRNLDSSTVVATLIAGKNSPVGSLWVTALDEGLRVTYALKEGWLLDETHLEVAFSLLDIPQTKKGNPIPGKFTNSGVHSSGINEFSYFVSMDEAPASADTPIYVAAHAKVSKDGRSESAWAGGDLAEDFPGRNWATYVVCVLTPLEPNIEIVGTWSSQSGSDLFMLTISNTVFVLTMDGSAGAGVVKTYNNRSNTVLLMYTDHPTYRDQYMKLTWESGIKQASVSVLSTAEETLYITTYASNEEPGPAMSETTPAAPPYSATQAETTVTGTATLPGISMGSPYQVVLDTDSDMSNGWLLEETGIVGPDSLLSYTLTSVPEGTYYLYALVDRDSSGGSATDGDYFGFYGSPSTPPALANAYVPPSGTVTLDFVLDTWTLLEEIEVAGTWYNLDLTYPNPVELIISGNTFEYPDLGPVNGRFVFVDNLANYGVVEWTQHPAPEWEGTFVKFIWDPFSDGFISTASLNYEDLDDAMASTELLFPSRNVRGDSLLLEVGDITVFANDSYMPIKTNARWTYNYGAVQITGIDTETGGVTFTNVGTGQSDEKLRARIDSQGNYLEHAYDSDETGFMPLRDSFNGVGAVIYEDSALELGLSWRRYGSTWDAVDKNRRLFINTWTVTNTNIDITTPAPESIPYSGCLELTRVIEYPGGLLEDRRLTEVTYYVNPEIGFVEEIRTWTTVSTGAEESETNYLISYEPNAEPLF